MDEHQHSEREATEDQHVHEASRAELREEESLGRVQGEPPDPDPEAGANEAPAGEPNTSADLGSGAGTTTSDPGRRNSIIPGEGKVSPLEGGDG